ncbi:MAG: hypothetical protein AAFZ17_13465, partial [Cyanobacteria bacterium J06650_10]
MPSYKKPKSPVLSFLKSFFQSLSQQLFTHRQTTSRVSSPPSNTCSPAQPLTKETTTDLDQQIQKEIRSEHQFSLAEAIGRESGSFMKGASAIPRPLRAKTEIKQFITTHTHKSTGALATSLYSWAETDIRVSRQLDTPLIALTQIIKSLL